MRPYWGSEQRYVRQLVEPPINSFHPTIIASAFFGKVSSVALGRGPSTLEPLGLRGKPQFN